MWCVAWMCYSYRNPFLVLLGLESESRWNSRATEFLNCDIQINQVENKCRKMLKKCNGARGKHSGPAVSEYCWTFSILKNTTKIDWMYEEKFNVRPNPIAYSRYHNWNAYDDIMRLCACCNAFMGYCTRFFGLFLDNSVESLTHTRKRTQCESYF